MKKRESPCANSTPLPALLYTAVTPRIFNANAKPFEFEYKKFKKHVLKF